MAAAHVHAYVEGMPSLALPLASAPCSYLSALPGLRQQLEGLSTYVDLLEMVATMRDNEQLAGLAGRLPRAGPTPAHLKGRTVAVRAPGVVAAAAAAIAAAAAAAAAAHGGGTAAAAAAGGSGGQSFGRSAGSGRRRAAAAGAAAGVGIGAAEGQGGGNRVRGRDGDEGDEASSASAGEEEEGSSAGRSERVQEPRRRASNMPATLVGVGIRRLAKGSLKFRPSIEGEC